MPRARRTTTAPQIDDLHLDGLEEGDPAVLSADADVELLSFTGLDLPTLTLTHARVTESRFSGLSAPEADLRNAHLAEVEFDQVNLPVVRAARSQWRDVRVSGRLGSVEAYEAQWRAVQFTGCKLSFVNLRAAELTDVAFTDCVIEELDLLDSRIQRLRLTDTRIGNLNAQGGHYQDLDLRGAGFDSIDGVLSLRGATITSDQLMLLAPLLASGLGLTVED